MDSPIRQASPTHFRSRTDSSLSVHSQTIYSGIRKKSSSPSHFSAAQTDRIQHALGPYSTPDFNPSSLTSSGLQWITPQQSPQPRLFPDSISTTEPFPQWVVPTPPRSDSGVPPVSIDAKQDPSTSAAGSTQNYGFGQPSTTGNEMSSLGFLLPSQYGGSLYESESNHVDQSFPPMRSAPASGPPAFNQTISSSPALYQSRPAPAPLASRRPDAPSTSSADSSYSSSYRRISSPYGSVPGSEYSMGSGQTIPPITGLTQGALSSPPIGHSPSGMMGGYSQSIPRSQNPYENPLYPQPPTSAPLYPPSHGSYPGSMPSDMPKSDSASMRVLNQRPKPQCWEHGCNGRQFSTFSNLLRHQREKSGTASKSYCPKCNAEFTRTTARNGHVLHDKCTKTRRDSEEQA